MNGFKQEVMRRTLVDIAALIVGLFAIVVCFVCMICLFINMPYWFIDIVGIKEKCVNMSKLDLYAIETFIIAVIIGVILLICSMYNDNKKQIEYELNLTVSKDVIVCPYCGHRYVEHEAFGTSGLINHNGGAFALTCGKCNNDFDGKYEVSIEYTTKKIKQ